MTIEESQAWGEFLPGDFLYEKVFSVYFSCFLQPYTPGLGFTLYLFSLVFVFTLLIFISGGNNGVFFNALLSLLFSRISGSPYLRSDLYFVCDRVIPLYRFISFLAPLVMSVLV